MKSNNQSLSFIDCDKMFYGTLKGNIDNNVT
jgi:hypothetical protein